MKLLQEQDEDAYKRHFSRFIAANIKADDVSYFQICLPKTNIPV